MTFRKRNTGMDLPFQRGHPGSENSSWQRSSVEMGVVEKKLESCGRIDWQTSFGRTRLPQASAQAGKRDTPALASWQDVLSLSRPLWPLAFERATLARAAMLPYWGDIYANVEQPCCYCAPPHPPQPPQPPPSNLMAMWPQHNNLMANGNMATTRLWTASRMFFCCHSVHIQQSWRSL